MYLSEILQIFIGYKMAWIDRGTHLSTVPSSTMASELLHMSRTVAQRLRNAATRAMSLIFTSQSICVQLRDMGLINSGYKLMGIYSCPEINDDAPLEGCHDDRTCCMVEARRHGKLS